MSSVAEQSLEERPPTWKVWLIAVRPKTLSAGLIPVVIASSLCYYSFYMFSWLAFFCALSTTLFLQIGINLSNDVCDFEKGADTKDRIGFARVTQKGWLSPRSVRYASYAAFTLGLLCSLPVGWNYPAVIALVLASIIFGYLYTGGPYPLAYLGLAEVFTILFFGWAITGTTYFAQAQIFHPQMIVAGLQVGLLSCALICMNNLRDIHQDKLAGKNTLAVRFGVEFARYEIAACFLFTYLLGYYWWREGSPTLAIYPLPGLAFALLIIYKIFKEPPSTKYNQYFVMTSAHNLLFALLFCLACL